MSKLLEKIQGLDPGTVALLEVPLEENLLGLVAGYLGGKHGGAGIYVSPNRPVSDLVSKLSAHGFDLTEALESGRIYVIDLVSKSVGNSEIRDCMYVSSPSELSATQLAIERAFDRIKNGPGGRWLLLDSISTVLVYNSPDAVLQFLHFLIGRLRVLCFEAVILTVQGSVEERTLATIRQFCDLVVRP